MIQLPKAANFKDYDGYLEEETDPIFYRWTIETKGRRIRHTVSVEKGTDVIVQYVHGLKDVTDALEETGFEVEVKDGIDPRKHYVIARK